MRRPTNDTDGTRIGRRQVLRGATALSLAGLASGGILAGRVRAQAERRPDDGETLAAALDTNFDLRDDVRILETPDPGPPAETPSRGRVLHATSEGVTTEDYAVTLAVTDDVEIELGDVAGTDGPYGADAFRYDYYTGADETGYTPDEAWLVVYSQVAETEGLHSVLRTEVDPDPAATWKTRDVAAEVVGEIPAEGSGQEWKEFDSGALGLTRIGTDMVDRFGADARVLAAGVGRGTPRTEPSVADVYFDEFVLAGEERELAPTHGPGDDDGDDDDDDDNDDD